MAVPKVFISSTCFDLSEIREQLKRFVLSFGFEPVLSEYGDVFYHPDLHTHEACVHEVSNCQLFILIVGGRFGGQYISDKNKSITNAEYEAAKSANIPVFTYIRNNVLNNHHVYKENKNQDFVYSISFPAIDKQDYAQNIFQFIDDVRKSPTNNAFEGFDNFNDIEMHLRKQWAGMFFDFLRTREVKSQIDATNHLLSGLKSSHAKLEDLIKSLYRSSVSNLEIVETSIDNIEILSHTRNFFNWLIDLGSDFPIKISSLGSKDEIDVEKIANISPKSLKWDEYLVKIGLFNREPFENSNDIMFHTGEYGFVIDHNDSENHKKLRLSFEKGIQKSTVEQRRDIIKEFVE